MLLFIILIMVSLIGFLSYPIYTLTHNYMANYLGISIFAKVYVILKLFMTSEKS